MSFDYKCFELATYFLGETRDEEVRNTMAQAIQDTVEGFLFACPACRGHGVLKGEQPCKTCDQTGNVTVAQYDAYHDNFAER